MGVVERNQLPACNINISFPLWHDCLWWRCPQEQPTAEHKSNIFQACPPAPHAAWFFLLAVRPVTASEHEDTSWSCTQQEGFQFIPASGHSSRPQPGLYKVSAWPLESLQKHLRSLGPTVPVPIQRELLPQFLLEPLFHSNVTQTVQS